MVPVSQLELKYFPQATTLANMDGATLLPDVLPYLAY
jgi:hypothetical protein